MRFFLIPLMCLLFFPPLGGAQAQQINYAWPFPPERDVAKEVGSDLIVLEIFTTQACMFCPTADRFFNDLITKIPTLIGLSCHIDYFTVKEGSLATPDCSARQDFYARHIEGSMTYTPQMVINGKVDVVGYKTTQVLNKLLGANQNPIQSLALTRDENTVTFSPPQRTPEKMEAQIWVAVLRSPVTLTAKSGASAGQSSTYKNVVQSLTKLQDWNGMPDKISFTPNVTKDTERVVVMIQNEKGIIAVGQIVWAEKSPTSD